MKKAANKGARSLKSSRATTPVDPDEFPVRLTPIPEFLRFPPTTAHGKNQPQNL
jgi:hypothetical protein